MVNTIVLLSVVVRHKDLVFEGGRLTRSICGQTPKCRLPIPTDVALGVPSLSTFIYPLGSSASGYEIELHYVRTASRRSDITPKQ